MSINGLSIVFNSVINTIFYHYSATAKHILVISLPYHREQTEEPLEAAITMGKASEKEKKRVRLLPHTLLLPIQSWQHRQRMKI